MDRMKPELARELRTMSLAEADEADREDRSLSTPQMRFDSMETLRRLYFGYDDDPPRLERLLERATLGEHKVSSDWRARPRIPR
jgi:hypothetical protein